MTTLLDQCAGVDLEDLIVAPTKEDSRGVAAAARIERVVAFRVDLRTGHTSAAAGRAGAWAAALTRVPMLSACVTTTMTRFE